MAGDVSQNHFVVTWIIENYSCCVLKTSEFIASPYFIIKELDSSEFRLQLFPKGDSRENKHIGIFLERNQTGNTVLSYDIQILNKDGLLTSSTKATNHNQSFSTQKSWGWSNFIRQNDLVEQRKDLLYNDCLKLRARIWATKGIMQDMTHCVMRTRMHKKMISATLEIEKLSSITNEAKKTVWEPVAFWKSPKVKVNLLLEGGINRNESVSIEIEVKESRNFKLLIASFSILNSLDEKVDTKEDEIWLNSNENSKVWKLPCFLPKETLTKKGYGKNDSLRLYVKILALKGSEYQAIESYVSGPLNSEAMAFFSELLPIKKNSKEINSVNDISHDLQALQTDKLFSDITLKVGNQSFPVHRVLLSARSPVFRAMLTSDMKESMEGIVYIEDIDCGTLQNLLHFIYTDSVGDLQLESAKKLYKAADKYEVLLLKKKCSDFLLENISVGNMCDFLLLADSHHDNSLKSNVQEFFLQNYSEVIKTDTWRAFMESNGTLAAELCMHQMLSSKF